MSQVLWDANAIQKVDDYTVAFNCKVPQVAVPEHLFHYPMAILHPDDKGVFGVGAQGTGAFELTDFAVGQKATLQAPRRLLGRRRGPRRHRDDRHRRRSVGRHRRVGVEADPRPRLRRSGASTKR